MFLFFSRQKDIKPTYEGRKQFYEHQSFGVEPKIPDLFYERLAYGKRMFDLSLQEYKKLYFSGEWWGWLTIVRDWQDELWVLPYLFIWEKNINSIIKDMLGKLE